jgi:predicted acyl esterase
LTNDAGFQYMLIYPLGSQWRVAARKPKGLAAIIPWEGMTDYYRDRCRHGGIFSDEFIRFWWNRQVITNQYGRPGRASSKWGEDTIEGSLDEETLSKNRNDQNIDNEKNRFLDDEYYKSKEFNLEDIEVPVLSVANWGGILLHLRGKFPYQCTFIVAELYNRECQWIYVGRF